MRLLNKISISSHIICNSKKHVNNLLFLYYNYFILLKIVCVPCIVDQNIKIKKWKISITLFLFIIPQRQIIY